jgi:hypothetical protein
MRANSMPRMLSTMPPTALSSAIRRIRRPIWISSSTFPNEDSRLFLAHLVPSHNAKKVILVSGDRDTEVRYLAAQLNIAEVHAAKSPEDKIAIGNSFGAI